MKIKFLVATKNDLDEVKMDGLTKLGISVNNVLKKIHIFVCETEKDTFEKLFSTTLTRKSNFVNNLNGPGTTVTNWVKSSPIIIPQEILDLGVDFVELDQEIALTD